MKAKRIVYLIHSMIYSNLAARDPQTIHNTNAGIYLERELLCERRWRAAIGQLEPNAIYAQLASDVGGGDEILSCARQQLGDDRVIVPEAEWHDGIDPEHYKQNLTDSFLSQLADKGHDLDRETTELELWGESFTGCVYGYGTALCRQVGLNNPAFVNFDMTVPDERLLCKAELVTHFLLPDSATRGYLFDGPLGYPIGLFIDGFRRSDAGATGTIKLTLDTSKVMLESPTGITLYAHLSVDRPNRRIPVMPTRDSNDIAATAEGLEIPQGCAHSILGVLMSPAALLAAMQTATVRDA